MNDSTMREIANSYEAAAVFEDTSLTRACYAEFVKECRAQFEALPVTVEFTDADPYENSFDLFEDIERGHMRVYTGGAPHPLLTAEENNIFRAVHDYNGHFLTRHGFGPKGETAAWVNHARMFSPLARLALHTETIGQVAFYFFNRDNRRRYADQKAFIFPGYVLNLLKTEVVS